VATKQEVPQFDNNPQNKSTHFDQGPPMSHREQRIIFSEDRKNEFKAADYEYKRDPVINRFNDY
jgi:hypothetical protein